MPPSKHALLGASNSHRWLACTPSALWESKLPEQEVKVAAEEGTLAHAVAEEHLQRLLAGKKVATSKKLKDNPLYRPAMEEHVGVYTDYVLEHLSEARAKTKDAIIRLEERVDYSAYAPDGYGTADCLIIADGEIQVFDLKYGTGVPVDAVGNPQIRLYALGALEAYDMLYDLQTVTMHIVQPRLAKLTQETMTVSALRKWAEEYVKPRAALAAVGDGEKVAGDHCGFCKARNICRVRAEYCTEIARHRFAEDGHENESDELTPEEIGSILDRVDDLVRWAKAMKDYALDQAVNHGVTFPGYKVVQGRSNRVITDEAKAIDLLDSQGFTTDRVTKLRGIGELEEIVGAKALANILGDILIKPSGKPVLAKESDKRPALNTAKEAFSAAEEGGDVV